MKQTFNPKARWDRNIPRQENNPEENCGSLDEKIDALVWFKNGKIFPRIFTWKQKKYKIKNISYTWQERRGQELITYFSVNTGIDLYQISFNNTIFSWRIDKVIT